MSFKGGKQREKCSSKGAVRSQRRGGRKRFRSPAYALILREVGPKFYSFLGSHWDEHLTGDFPKHGTEGTEKGREVGRTEWMG